MATVYEKASDECDRHTVQPGASNLVQRTGAGETYSLGGAETARDCYASSESLPSSVPCIEKTEFEIQLTKQAFAKLPGLLQDR